MADGRSRKIENASGITKTQISTRRSESLVQKRERSDTGSRARKPDQSRIVSYPSSLAAPSGTILNFWVTLTTKMSRIVTNNNPNAPTLSPNA